MAYGNLKATFAADGYIIYHGIRIRKIEQKTGTSYEADLGKRSGRHVRKRFPSINAAKDFVERMEANAETDGIKAWNFTGKERAKAVDAMKVLKPFGVSLLEAAEYYAKHHQTVDDTNSTAALVDKYLTFQSKKVTRNELRPRSYTECENHLSGFKSKFGHMAISTITADDIDNWLDDGFAPTSRANHKRYVSGFFNHFVKTDVIEANPVTKCRTVSKVKRTPEIYTAAQTKSIMKAASSVTKKEPAKQAIVPYLALGLFAGIRPTELQRLKWEDIDFQHNEIVITPETAKTKSARIVHAPANLMKWLAVYKQSGLVFPHSEHILRQWRREVFAKAKVKAIQDGARHSFATYHLAKFESIDSTVQELGHTDNRMLFDHYAGLAKNRTEQASTYFKIDPPKDASIIQFREAVA